MILSCLNLILFGINLPICSSVKILQISPRKSLNLFGVIIYTPCKSLDSAISNSIAILCTPCKAKCWIKMLIVYRIINNRMFDIGV